MLNPLTHRNVLKNGVRGRAEVVAMGSLDRQMARANLPMTLQVYVEGWSPYEVEGEWVVKPVEAEGLSDWIPVRVDPDDLQKVAIDWDGIRERRERPVADAIARLERLGDLRAAGVLTDDEFDRQKQRILDER